jgi:hypothetical protein
MHWFLRRMWSSLNMGDRVQVHLVLTALLPVLRVMLRGPTPLPMLPGLCVKAINAANFTNSTMSWPKIPLLPTVAARPIPIPLPMPAWPIPMY